MEICKNNEIIFCNNYEKFTELFILSCCFNFSYSKYRCQHIEANLIYIFINDFEHKDVLKLSQGIRRQPRLLSHIKEFSCNFSVKIDLREISHCVSRGRQERKGQIKWWQQYLVGTILVTGTSVHNQQGCRRKAHLACFYLFSSLFLIKQKAT